ncbi:MAG TPA: type II toxin-antitoxin system RatA family toxin [Rhizomicrobium sp.]|nr:type II toxin-antitoxin system RatA family toxin [Rhizomicrobium sp.]
MSSHTETRLLPYSADLMFGIVADVERYPEFLPWCTGLRVLSRSKEDGRDILIAEMLVGYRALRERYTSRVVLDPAARTIDVTQTAGPFRILENHWRFVPKENGCEVTFRIDFEFKSRLLNMVAGQAFEHVLFRMADAFETRARELSEHPL